MDSENPASDSEKAEQFSPDQENDIILTTNETPLLKKVDKTEDAFEVIGFFHTWYTLRCQINEYTCLFQMKE